MKTTTALPHCLWLVGLRLMTVRINQLHLQQHQLHLTHVTTLDSKTPASLTYITWDFKCRQLQIYQMTRL